MSIEPANQTPLRDLPKKEWTFLGVNRADYVKIIIGLLISASICLFAFWVNWRSPHLKVTIPDIIAYKGEKNQLGIVNVTVSNDGSKEAEDVECWLNLAGSKIQEVKASPEYLNAVVTPKDDKIRVDVHLLNPKEDLLISALISNPEKLPEQAKVEVRGKGVIGEKDAKTQETGWFVVLGTVVAIYVFIAMLLALSSVLFPALPKFVSKSANDAVIRLILYSDALNRKKELPGSRQRRLEKLCDDALSKIGDQLRKDSLDEHTKQKALEYIKNYFDDLK